MEQKEFPNRFARIGRLPYLVISNFNLLKNRKNDEIGVDFRCK